MDGVNGLLDARRIAVVGVAKNCGKTTTLNRLLELAVRSGRELGLMSIGIDGESEDVLLGTPKPPIHVEPGQWVITAEDAAHASSAVLEYYETMGFETPLGAVVMTRVREAGEVILAGLRHRGDVRAGIEALERHGVNLVMVDGAYGRIASAHAGVTDGVVLSTGAVVSEHVEGVVEKTAELMDRLTLEAIEEPWHLTLLERATRENQCFLGGPSIAPLALPSRSALVGLPQARGLWAPEVEAVAVPGLVSDRVVEELIRAGGPRTLLVPDGTALQADGKLLERLRRTWQVRVGSPARVLGIAVNPTSVQGWTLSEEALTAALRARWPKITIFNPKYGLGSGPNDLGT